MAELSPHTGGDQRQHQIANNYRWPGPSCRRLRMEPLEQVIGRMGKVRLAVRVRMKSPHVRDEPARAQARQGNRDRAGTKKASTEVGPKTWRRIPGSITNMACWSRANGKGKTEVQSSARLASPGAS